MGDKGVEDIMMVDEVAEDKRTKNPRPFEDDTASKKRQKTSAEHTSQPCSTIFLDGRSTFVVPPAGEHTHTVIFLHDNDTTPVNFASDFFQASTIAGRDLENDFPSVKWIFPSSGRPDSTWFDQQTFNAAPEQLDKLELQHAGMCHSLGPLLDLIDAEVNIVGGTRVCLAGMGQGCAMAAVAFLTGWHAVDCFIGLAGWLPYQAQLEAIIASSEGVIDAQQHMREFFPSGRKGMPHWHGALGKTVLLLQCNDDEQVPAARSNGLFRIMNDMSMKVQRRVYSMGGHDGVTESHAVGEVARVWDIWAMPHEGLTMSPTDREFILGGQFEWSMDEIAKAMHRA